MNSIVESFTTVLLKKNIIELSHIEKSFFIYKKLDKSIKFTEEIIKLNYLKESPYSFDETHITSIVEGSNLYLWFNKNENKKYLPESLLIYKHLKKKYNNVICLIKGKQDKLIIIKESILFSSFSKKELSEQELFLLKKEYMIDEVLILKNDEYHNVLENSYASLSISDLFQVLNIQIDFKKFFSNTVQWLAFPFFLSSLFITLVLAGYNFYTEKKTDTLENIYKENQYLSRDMKDKLTDNELENITFNLLAEEFEYIDKTVGISTIIKITEEMNMTMHYIKVYNNQVDFIIKTKNQFDIPIYVKKLFNSSKLVDIKNLSSQNLRDKRVQVRMSAKLKKR